MGKVRQGQASPEGRGARQCDQGCIIRGFFVDSRPRGAVGLLEVAFLSGVFFRCSGGLGVAQVGPGDSPLASDLASALDLSVFAGTADGRRVKAEMFGDLGRSDVAGLGRLLVRLAIHLSAWFVSCCVLCMLHA